MSDMTSPARFSNQESMEGAVGGGGGIIGTSCNTEAFYQRALSRALEWIC